MKYFDLEILGNYFLWKVAEAERNRSDELFYSNRYLVLRDSVNNLDISGRVAKFQFQVEMDQKQRENELLKTNELQNKATILQQNQERIGLMLVLTLSLALLYFQWGSARRQRRANVILTEQRDQIASQATEISRLNSTLQNHLVTLFDFSKSKSVNFGSMDEAAKDIARLTGRTLSASRVSIWKYIKETDTIESIVCYELATDSFKDKLSFPLSDYPEYAKAVHGGKMIVANDARADSQTREFKNSYLLPFDIHSMLDVTYSIDGQLGGLLCCEQQGTPREWKPEDLIFTKSVSDIITLTLRSVQRREYEKQLRQHSREIERVNETLERRVAERTLELENQIRKAREASKALQVSEERYRSIITVSNTGAWEYHIETGRIWYSSEYFAMLGIDKPGGHWDESLEDNWVARLHPDDLAPSTKVVDDFLKAGSLGWYENIYRMRHQNGDWIWIWSRGRRLRDANNELTNTILGTHIDITARKIAEEKIEQNAQLIRKITSQVPANTYMFEIDERGVANILFLNRGTEEYNHDMELKDESENSDRIREIIHQDDKIRFGERMKEAYHTSQPITFQYRIVVDGNIRWRWMKAVPDKDQNGKILWYGATSDITALVDYIVSVEQIIFDIGHVIRRPVSSMLGMTKLITDNNLPVEEIKDISRKLHKISEEMDKFSRELNAAYHEKSQLAKFNIDVSSSIDKRSTLFS
ncbi:MAG: PAS domain-containing protein [Bacteroidota bacterium]